jgi:two-component system, sensor histidine kinase and response regulator
MAAEMGMARSITVFRAVREYTESFTTGKKNVDDVYEAMGDIFQKKLHIDVAIYRAFNKDFLFQQVYASPQHHYLPKTMGLTNGSLSEEASLKFEGRWWMLPFGGKLDPGKGYVALHVDLENRERDLPAGSIFIDNGDIQAKGWEDSGNGEMVQPQTSEFIRKDYFVDLIVNIVEHFGSALTQVVIMKRNEELIEELKEQNKALLFAREENKVAVQQGKEWVSVMSHEIRTPLFAINSLSELLLDKWAGQEDADAETVSSLNLIVNSGRHLSELVNNILDLNKLQSDQLTLEQLDFEFRDLVNDCVAINVRNDQRLYPHTCIFIDRNVPKILIGDALRVKQIIMNLISNSVKFSPDEGVVQIHVSAETGWAGGEENVRITVAVSDTGIGIKPEDTWKVFRPFSQTDASITRKFGGSGLGLSICKRLCLLMGGDISFAPNGSQGTVFTFHIILKVDLNAEDNKQWDLSQTIPEAVRKWRFLVVDDNDISRSCNQTHLLNFGIENITAVSVLPDIEEEKEKEDYDVYLVNTRAKSVIENVDLLKRKIAEQHDRVILQNYPYAKKMLGLTIPIMAEIYGPVTERELTIALTTLAERRNVVNAKKAKLNEISAINMHILVAEDNKINQAVLKKLLARFEITADFADNGQIAVNLYKEDQSKYKVILMDLQMPVMDGLAAATEIRKLSRDNKSPYIIALTAEVFWEARVRATEAGMNAFVTKPVKMPDLHAALLKATALPVDP